MAHSSIPDSFLSMFSFHIITPLMIELFLLWSWDCSIRAHLLPSYILRPSPNSMWMGLNLKNWVRKRVVRSHHQSESDADHVVLILCVYLLVFFNYVNFKITVCLPLWLPDFNHGDLFGKDCVTDVISEQFLTNWPVFFAFVHESPEVKREVDGVGEQHLASQTEEFLNNVRLLLDIQAEIIKEEFFGGQRQLVFILQVINFVSNESENVIEEHFR